MAKTIFITGANRGLGLEFTRQFLQAGDMVLASCRYPDKATALQALHREYTDNLKILALDMLDDQSLKELPTTISMPIDILLLNAGTSGERGVTVGNVDLTNIRTVFDTNSFAPVCLADTLLTNVHNSNEKLIVAITSKMGSIEDNDSGRSYAYRGSKAALNAMMFALSIDVKPYGVKVLLLHPGWVRTDMGGESGLIDVQTSISGMRNIIAHADNYASGSFLDYQGKVIPW